MSEEITATTCARAIICCFSRCVSFHAGPSSRSSLTSSHGVARESRSYSINSFVSEDSFTLETEKSDQKGAADPSIQSTSSSSSPEHLESDQKHEKPLLHPESNAPANVKENPIPASQDVKSHVAPRSPDSLTIDQPLQAHTNHRRWSSVVSDGHVESCVFYFPE